MTIDASDEGSTPTVTMMVDTSPFSDTIIFALGYRICGDFYAANPVEFCKANKGSYVKPSFKITGDEAQQLFNRLWLMGYRHKDGSGNDGHVGALKYHLEDMRRLVFKNKKEG